MLQLDLRIPYQSQPTIRGESMKPVRSAVEAFGIG